MGIYLHGLFTSDTFRATFLKRIGGHASGLRFDAEIEATLDRLADHIEAHLHLDQMLEISEAGL